MENNLKTAWDIVLGLTLGFVFLMWFIQELQSRSGDAKENLEKDDE
jgi:hypothetical protein